MASKFSSNLHAKNEIKVHCCTFSIRTNVHKGKQTHFGHSNMHSRKILHPQENNRTEQPMCACGIGGENSFEPLHHLVFNNNNNKKETTLSNMK